MYPAGFGTSLFFAAAGACSALTLEYLHNRMNKKAAEKTEDEWRQIYTDDQLEKMGDRSPLFKYSLYIKRGRTARLRFADGPCYCLLGTSMTMRYTRGAVGSS